MRVLYFHTCLVILLFTASILAQSETQDQSEKDKSMSTLIDQVSAEVPNFRLSENRAIVLAKLGALLCSSNKDRAHSNFQTAVTELLNAQNIAELNKARFEQQSELLTGETTRPQILDAIAGCDAEFALESLYKTRPAAVVKAMSGEIEKGKKAIVNGIPFEFLARREMQQEQALMRRAAQQSPEHAEKLLKESLKKGISYETLGLLRDLFAKDPEAATDIAADVVSTLRNSTFLVNGQPDTQTLAIAGSILNDHIQQSGSAENHLKFDDGQMRSLAARVIAFIIQHPQYQSFLQASAIAEKLAPSMSAALKQASGARVNGGSSPQVGDISVAQLLSSDQSPSTLISEAKKFPVESRRQVYQAAANKMAQEGNVEGGAAVLSENLSGDELENAVNSMNWYYAHALISAGRFDEAERAIGLFPEGNRNAALIDLALFVFRRDREKNKTAALGILNRVKEQLQMQPANSNELSKLMQLVSAYLEIEPEDAFEILEPLVPHLSDVSEAAVVMFGFQGNMNIKDGEYPVGQGPLGFYLDPSVFERLAQKDLERTIRLIDGFSRREMRVWAKLSLIEHLKAAK